MEWPRQVQEARKYSCICPWSMYTSTHMKYEACFPGFAIVAKQSRGKLESVIQTARREWADNPRVWHTRNPDSVQAKS